MWFILAFYPNGSLIELSPDGRSFSTTKTLWALGNFSKFIRPGFVRIGAAMSSSTGKLYASAYKDPISEQLVIVAINQDAQAVKVKFNMGFTTNATPYVTSASQNLAPQSDVWLGNAVTIPAKSIVTYVAQPPRLTSDILWRNTDGIPMIWLGGLSTTASYPEKLGNDWQIQGVGDFDGNGVSDILWRCAPQAPATACGNAIAGATAIWPDGGHLGTLWPGALENGWQIQGVGDFDGNGVSDILWRYRDGTIAIWPNGFPAGTLWPGALENGWQIQGVGRFDR